MLQRSSPQTRQRYPINSPMQPNLKLDANGGLTLYLQHDSPGQDKEANWLPVPNGPFFGVLRLHLPDETAPNGRWQLSHLQKVQ